MSIYDLRPAAHDQSAPEGPLRQTLLICTTPRTASHYLSNLAYRAGWGVPMEYFSPPVAENMLTRWGGGAVESPEEFAAYARALQARRTCSGIFAAKLFIHHLPFAEKCLRHFSSPRCHVLLTRRNKVAQTLSLLTVYLTQQPYEDGSAFDVIGRLKEVTERDAINTFRWICLGEAKWRRLLGRAGSVVEIATEDMLSEPGKTREILAQHLDLPRNRPIPPSALPPQARYDTNASIKQELAEKYRNLLEDLQNESQRDGSSR